MELSPGESQTRFRGSASEAVLALSVAQMVFVVVGVVLTAARQAGWLPAGVDSGPRGGPGLLSILQGQS